MSPNRESLSFRVSPRVKRKSVDYDMDDRPEVAIGELGALTEKVLGRPV